MTGVPPPNYTDSTGTNNQNSRSRSGEVTSEHPDPGPATTETIQPEVTGTDSHSSSDPPNRSAPAAAMIALVASCVGIVVLLAGTGQILSGVVAAVAGACIAGLLWAARRGTPWSRAIASGLAILSGVATVAAVAVGIQASSDTLSVFLFVGLPVTVLLVTTGVISTFTGAIGDWSVGTALGIVTVTATILLGVAAGSLLVTTPEAYSSNIGEAAQIFSTGATTAIDYLTSPGGFVEGLITLSLLIGITSSTVAMALPRLPIDQFIADSEEPDVEARINAVARHGGVVGILAFVSCLLVPLIHSVYPLEQLVTYAPTIATILQTAISITELRLTLLAVTGLFLTLWFVAWLLPWLARRRNGATVRWFPAIFLTVLVAGAVGAGYQAAHETVVAPLLETVVADATGVSVPILGVISSEVLFTLAEPPVGSILAVATIGLALVGLAVLLGALVVSGVLRILPRRSTPGALAAAGLIGGSILAAALDAPLLVILVPVACAVLVWDIAAYGVSITDELRPDAAQYTPVVVHAVGSVAVGCAAIALSLGGYHTVVGTISPAYTVATALPLVGVLLTSFALVKHRAKTASHVSHAQRDSETGPQDQMQDSTDSAQSSATPAEANSETGVEDLHDTDVKRNEQTPSQSSTEEETKDPSSDGKESEMVEVDRDTPSAAFSVLGAIFVFVGLLAILGVTSTQDFSTAASLTTSALFLLFAAGIIAYFS